ncbi:MAG: HU family DNA-binding protein [Desulfomonilaceae bacterium]
MCIPDLGTFLVFHKKARLELILGPGKKIKVLEGNVPLFKASRLLKQAVHEAK